jgi:hypothetical protein
MWSYSPTLSTGESLSASVPGGDLVFTYTGTTIIGTGQSLGVFSADSNDSGAVQGYYSYETNSADLPIRAMATLTSPPAHRSRQVWRWWVARSLD